MQSKNAGRQAMNKCRRSKREREEGGHSQKERERGESQACKGCG